ncbi:DJ-1/PfpI/YhbO family deglycase/protease [Sphingomicrobium astaxanthinifaciens]|uniref:DJ-1/PfpI/YhbO family deglycase/protease n=1 Tax=Sphingomicrobium astaxanthinifaciens TaxID=1227949 RepID=UPI001FCC3D66|nr:type 1 glutamine amidotransferase domain-containing protein [Sphingomicrobium astaxanthinifaciens]MCJ7420547.1 type 1 glutamine amidotransferase [Sphingomicrobium astaxanthinifaciens]
MQDLTGKRVLIMATEGFEELELTGPRDRLGAAGAQVVIASVDRNPFRGRVKDEPTIWVQPDLLIGEADVADFDALVLPGGVINPDQLRTHAEAIDLIKAFDAASKPVAAICHGPWLLVEADVVRGRKVTCWPSIRTDLRNAGGEVVDRESCTDGHLITSRNPDDVPAFCAAIAAAIAEVST